jgi:ankyrin repeat protein
MLMSALMTNPASRILALIAPFTLALLLAIGVARAGVSEDLMDAVSAADVDAVRSLLDAGADPDFISSDGTTPLGAALMTALDRKTIDTALEIIQLLADREADLDAPARAGQPAIIYAMFGAIFMPLESDTGGVNSMSQRIITLLVKNGADLFVKISHPNDPLGDSAWSLAASTFELMEILLEAGADPNEENAEGETPLSLAVGNVKYQNTAVLQTLIKNGADVNQKNINGNTALFSALLNRYTLWRMGRLSLSDKSIKYLIEAGANINIANNMGVTPIMQAVKGLFPDFVSVLLKAGADVGAIDESGKGALFYIAKGIVQRDQLRWLSARETESPRQYALPAINTVDLQEIVDLLVGAGANPALNDFSGKTALSDARAKANDLLKTGHAKSELRRLVEILELARSD